MRGDGSYQSNEFDTIRKRFLPSEEIRFVAEEKSGFIVLTDRRFVYVTKEKDGFRISNTLPLDLVIRCEHKKKDTWKIEYHDVDYPDGSIKAKKKGSSVQYSTSDLDVKHPKNADVESFTNAMSEFNSVLKDTLGNSPYSDGVFTPRDYSHLQPLRMELSEDDVLLLNTVLSTRPERDELQDDAREIVGENPYIVWRPTDVTHLLVVGEKTSLFLKGIMKEGILLGRDGIKFEADQILNLTSNWMKPNPHFVITKSDLFLGELKATPYLFTWNPQQNEALNLGDWFYDPANAIWIISDMIFSQQRAVVKANFASSELIDDPIVRKQRYFW
ncbi:MAG: hypothetical protein ACXADF_18670 [Candidatus Thorarchaeota archaeon]